jgi:two-component system sensor histidine kinase HydH
VTAAETLTEPLEVADAECAERAESLFEQYRQDVFRRADRLLVTLMCGQWLFAILLAITYSPYGWSGKQQVVHAHVYAAVLLGGAITSLPLLLVCAKSSPAFTRYVIACAQMLWSALLIHLSGGRVETHFHVFGSLAFLAFYRDWSVLVPATVTVAADHLVRQLYWPESVYGVMDPEWWRFLEHAWWVLFEDTVLVFACIRGRDEMREIAQRQAMLEWLSERERLRSQQLADSQDALLRAEKLAAVGRLAASVGHELRNPLTALKNANAVLQKRLGAVRIGGVVDAGASGLLDVMDNEVAACTRIVGDLLDFSRERPLKLEPTPLRALVEEALSVLPAHSIEIRNEIGEGLPVPRLDRGQFRQVLINLLQNAIESVPPERADGWVAVRAAPGENGALQLVVEDTGAGMPEEVAAKMFEPLFTTKVKGTGLGMPIVANILGQHGASIRVDSGLGRGTRISIELPSSTIHRAA